MLYWFVYHIVAPWIVGPLLKLFNRVEVTGLERIPTQGPAVIVANHISLWDPIYLYCLVRRRTWFMAKSELFDIPVLGFLLRLINVFPVKRNSLDRQALKKAAQVLGQGDALVIFPEGSRSRTGELQPFKQGAALFAHRSGAAVVPVLFENTTKTFPKAIGQRIRIVCGEPLDFAEFQGRKSDAALLKDMTEKLRQSIVWLQEGAAKA
jgi:1-acyl-sn-glycerol-3-phosphate acyltransferase